MAFFSHVYRSEFWKPDDRCFFQLILICFIFYLQYKSEKSHGLFGLDWKNQEHTVPMHLRSECREIKRFFSGSIVFGTWRKIAFRTVLRTYKMHPMPSVSSEIVDRNFLRPRCNLSTFIHTYFWFFSLSYVLHR